MPSQRSGDDDWNHESQILPFGSAPPLAEYLGHGLACQANMLCQFLLGDRYETIRAELSIELQENTGEARRRIEKRQRTLALAAVPETLSRGVEHLPHQLRF